MKVPEAAALKKPGRISRLGLLIAQPIAEPGFKKFLWIALALVGAILLAFMGPGRVDASDFRLIAFDPGRQWLTTGSVYAQYPYPMWTVVVFLPLAFLPSRTAELIWLICNWMMLSASLALLISMMEWEVNLPLFAMLVTLSGFFLPVLTSAWLGQLTILSLFLLALTTYLFLHHRWTWLGVVLGLSFIKPQVMILLAGLLLLWALWQRRWQVWIGFLAVITFLTLISLPFISFPGQLIGGGIGSHLSTYIRQTSTLWGLFLTLGLPWIAPLLACLIFLAWVGLSWLPFLRSRETPSRQVLYLFSLATLVNLLASPYSWMHNLTLSLLPFLFCMSLVLKLAPRPRAVWVSVLFLIMHPLMLLSYVLFSTPQFGQSFQVLPAVCLLAILVILYQYVPAPASALESS